MKIIDIYFYACYLQWNIFLSPIFKQKVYTIRPSGVRTMTKLRGGHRTTYSGDRPITCAAMPAADVHEQEEPASGTAGMGPSTITQNVTGDCVITYVSPAGFPLVRDRDDLDWIVVARHAQRQVPFLVPAPRARVRGYLFSSKLLTPTHLSLRLQVQDWCLTFSPSPCCVVLYPCSINMCGFAST